MKSKLLLSAIFSLIGLFLFTFSGCYTQLSTLRDEKEGDEEYTTTEQQNDNEYTNENYGEEYRDRSVCCDDSYRPQVGFSYYYPSTYWPSMAFAAAYANPWSYDYYWAYDPWNYYYSPYTWNSWYSPYYYYPQSYYGYQYGYSGAIVNGRRDIGEMRGRERNQDIIGNGFNGTTIGTRDYDMPTGASLGKTPDAAPPPNRKSSAVNQGSRQSSNQRSSVSRANKNNNRNSDSNVRSYGRRDGETRSARRRNTPPEYRPQEAQSPPQTIYTPPPKENRTNTPSYSPPPPPKPSSNDGSKRSGNDRSSGESRGRRP